MICQLSSHPRHSTVQGPAQGHRGLAESKWEVRRQSLDPLTWRHTVSFTWAPESLRPRPATLAPRPAPYLRFSMRWQCSSQTSPRAPKLSWCLSKRLRRCNRERRPPLRGGTCGGRGFRSRRWELCWLLTQALAAKETWVAFLTKNDPKLPWTPSWLKPQIKLYLVPLVKTITHPGRLFFFLWSKTRFSVVCCNEVTIVHNIVLCFCEQLEVRNSKIPNTK